MHTISSRPDSCCCCNSPYIDGTTLKLDKYSTRGITKGSPFLFWDIFITQYAAVEVYQPLSCARLQSQVNYYFQLPLVKWI